MAFILLWGGGGNYKVHYCNEIGSVWERAISNWAETRQQRRWRYNCWSSQWNRTRMRLGQVLMMSFVPDMCLWWMKLQSVLLLSVQESDPLCNLGALWIPVFDTCFVLGLIHMQRRQFSASNSADTRKVRDSWSSYREVWLLRVLVRVSSVKKFSLTRIHH